MLLLAAFLRLFRLQFSEYQLDDDSIWSAAVTAVSHHQFPNQGIASTIGVPSGPFQVLLMMPFAAITRAPLAGIVFMALLNIAAVYFVFRLVDEFFGRRPALLAAVLFAVNSWAVIYGRRLAVQGMLIPFQVLFFWSLARWLARGRGADLILAFLWLAVVSQVYIDGLLQVATLALALVLGWRNLRPLPLLTGAALCVGLFAPYMLGAVLPNLARFQSVSTGAPTIDAQSVGFTLFQGSHEGFELSAPQTQAFPYTTAGAQGWLEMLEEGLFAAGALYTLVRLIQAGRTGRASEARVNALLWLWLLVPIAVYLRHSEVLSWRHLALAIPLPAIFSGIILDRLWPFLGVPILGAVGANSVALAGMYLAVTPSCTTNNVYGLPYQSTFDLAHSIEALATENGTRRIYIDGYPALSPILSSIVSRDGFDAYWSDAAHEPELAALPDRPSVYVTLSEDTETDSARLLEARLSGRQALAQDLPCVGMTLREYVISPADLSATIASQPASPLNLATPDGIQLKSAIIDRRLMPGEPVRIGVSWLWSGGQRPGSNYWFFAHVVDSNGHAVGQQDVPLRPTSAWIPGESVLSWIDAPVPADVSAGRYLLELGMYDNRSVRSDLIDASGKSVGSSVIVQPLVVPPPSVAAAAGQLASAGARFGDAIELTGFRASPDGEVDLQWQALQRPDRDYTVFVHALDSSGKVVAQADGEPLDGKFPTGVWLPGDTVLDRHKLALLPGQYRVEVGLYYVPILERVSGEPFTFRLTAG